MNILGIRLTDADVTNVPMFRVDPYGEFIRGPNGMPQIVAAFTPAGQPIYVETSLGSPINPSAIQLPVGTQIMGSNGTVNTIEAGETVSAVRTGHAFLDDIAHSAVPGTTYDHDGNPATPAIAVSADADTVAENHIGFDSRGNKVAYDNELLDAHYITGDGRGNENVGLTAIHHVFHSEHNHLVEQVKEVALSSGDLAFLNQWLRVPVAAIPTTDAGKDALQWDGERLFQAARFTNEMEYQHLVFEEFARKMQPDIDAFVFEPSVDINPAIFAEFAQAVYRFGHSMLNETIDSITDQRPEGLDDAVRGVPQPAGLRSVGCEWQRGHRPRHRGRSHHPRHVPPACQRDRRVRHQRAAQPARRHPARPRGAQHRPRP